MVWDVVWDTSLDSLKLLPFLFVTYLALEFLEHKTGEKTAGWIARAGKLGPLYGGLCGMIPQCGFSAAASNLYAGRVITLGTLLAVFLSTSDEMLPIFLSQQVAVGRILKILLFKAVVGIFWGFLLDRVWMRKRKEPLKIAEFCENENCGCHESIWKGAFWHTVQVFIFIFLITLVLNGLLAFLGEDVFAHGILAKPGIGVFLAGLVGLIPNCGASVVLTQLYLDGLITFGAAMAGLLVGAGVGLLVLFRVNHRGKENLQIVGILYTMGVVTGLILEQMGIVL